MKKIILLSFILFLSFISNSYSEDLFKTLTSTYLDNKELNSQREKTKAVDETLIQSYSIFKPSISGSYTQNDILNEGQRAPDGSSLSDSNFQTEKKSIKIEQKILQGIPKSLAARTNVNIARQELKAVEQNVLLKAVDAYASILAAEKKLKITEDNLNLSDKQVELDKSRYERGAIKLSDLAQSESSLAGAQAKFIRAQNDLLVNEQNFINIVGYKPDELNKINNLNLKLPQNIDEALKLASENNPDLLIAELKLKKSNFDIFKNQFESIVKDSVGHTMFTRSFNYDLLIDFSKLTIENIKIIQRMAPFGLGNKRPVFRTNNCFIDSKLKFLGKEDQIVKSKIKDKNGSQLPFICFDKKSELVNLQSSFDVLYNVNLNSFSGKEIIELTLKEVFIKK